MSDSEPFLALITPVDPSNAPDNSLPGQPPGIWGGAAPPTPDNSLPEPPTTLWPPLPPDLPTQLPVFGWRPGTVWPPLEPTHPDNSLPEGPPPTIGGGPITPDAPPPTVGGGPVEPPPSVDNTLPPGVDNTLPTPPPTVGGGPVTPPAPKVLVLLAWVPGSGFRWVAVDPSLKPDNSLPPAPQPK